MIAKELQKKIKQIPASPGIYQMLDANNTIIYIGKSKCLKKRVSSYFVPNPKWEKAKKMAGYIHDIEYIVTDTHLDAMLLECEMIKEKRPYFNVLMKSEQKYVYLTLEKNYKKNPLNISYIKTDNAVNLLRSRSRLEEFIEGMRHIYPLKKKRNGMYRFEYHFLPIQMNEKEFEENRTNLKELCQNPVSLGGFIEQLEKTMQKEAKKMNYELATKYRDLAEHSRYLKNSLQTFQQLIGKELLYTVSLSKGYKLYYIKDGLVIQTQIVMDDLDTPKKFILKQIREGKIAIKLPYSEKECIDFLSIVYSELAASDESQITYI